MCSGLCFRPGQFHTRMKNILNFCLFIKTAICGGVFGKLFHTNFVGKHEKIKQNIQILQVQKSKIMYNYGCLKSAIMVDLK